MTHASPGRVGDQRASEGPGLALLAERSRQWAWRAAQERLGLAVRLLPCEVPVGAYRPPLLLDTAGMSPLLLVALLQALRTQPPRSVLAAVDGHDQRAAILLALSPAVLAVLPTLPAPTAVQATATVAILLQDLCDSGVRRLARTDTLGVRFFGVAPPAALPPAQLLPVLAELPHSATVVACAARCHMSRGSLYSLLRVVRATLGRGSPGPDWGRVPPAVLAALILDALG